jgi:hypothetical protein
MAVFAKASLFQKSQPESSPGEPLSAVAAAATVGSRSILPLQLQLRRSTFVETGSCESGFLYFVILPRDLFPSM